MNYPNRFQPGKSGNPATMWKRGQSGNPGGAKPQSRRQFEQALADALAGENPAESAKELADLVWKAARKGEAWAVQMLFQRLAPEPIKVKMEVSRGPDEIDFRRLTDEQLEQLERILEQISGPGPVALIEGGESSAPSA